MSPLATLFVWASFPFLSFVEIFGACLLFAWHQPKRANFALRLATVVALFALVALCLIGSLMLAGQLPDLEMLPGTSRRAGSIALVVTQTMGFGLFLGGMLPALVYCFDMGWWSALFCALAGYTLQNLGSGLGELVLLIAQAMGIPPVVGGAGILGLTCCLITYAIAYAPLIKPVNRANLDDVTDRSLLPILTVVIFAVIGFDVVLKTDAFESVEIGIVILARVFHGIFCLFTLFVELDMVVRRKLTIEVATATRLMAEHDRQLQLSRDTIDAINLKCHDLRHQIRHLADGGVSVDATVLADAAREVTMYDLAVKTGNQALDTILTEKRLLADQAQATLTCMADGKALSFMTPADLYALFGNALDNALEAVGRIEDPSRRSISLLVRERAGMVQVHVENTCPPDETATLENGLPQTSKRTNAGAPDVINHGFGTRSMRSIVERYGGTITFTPGDETFSLDAMIPLGD